MKIEPCPFDGGAAKFTIVEQDERYGYNLIGTVRCECGGQLVLHSKQKVGGWCGETPVQLRLRTVGAWNKRS